jgi:hypothetical protein
MNPKTFFGEKNARTARRQNRKKNCSTLGLMTTESRNAGRGRGLRTDGAGEPEAPAAYQPCPPVAGRPPCERAAVLQVRAPAWRGTAQCPPRACTLRRRRNGEPRALGAVVRLEVQRAVAPARRGVGEGHARPEDAADRGAAAVVPYPQAV